MVGAPTSWPSVGDTIVMTGGVASSTKSWLAGAVLPAWSVAVISKWWEPSGVALSAIGEWHGTMALPSSVQAVAAFSVTVKKIESRGDTRAWRWIALCGRTVSDRKSGV